MPPAAARCSCRRDGPRARRPRRRRRDRAVGLERLAVAEGHRRARRRRSRAAAPGRRCSVRSRRRRRLSAAPTAAPAVTSSVTRIGGPGSATRSRSFFLSYCADRLPARLVEARRVPARHLQARVVALAVDEVGATTIGPGVRLPAPVGDDRLQGAVGEQDLELRHHARRLRAAGARAPAQRGGAPAAGDDRADGVVAAPHQRRHVVGLEQRRASRSRCSRAPARPSPARLPLMLSS